MEELIIEAVDQIADEVEEHAKALGISSEELADRVLNEVKARDA